MKISLPDNPHGKLLTTKELAALFHVSTQAIFKWRREKRGPPYYRVNRLIQYREKDVMDWLEKGRNG